MTISGVLRLVGLVASGTRLADAAIVKIMCESDRPRENMWLASHSGTWSGRRQGLSAWFAPEDPKRAYGDKCGYTKVTRTQELHAREGLHEVDP